MATNPILSEINAKGATSPLLSPGAQNAARMAGYPAPATQTPSVLPPGALLPPSQPEPTNLITMPGQTPSLSFPSTPSLVTGPNKGQAILSNGAQPSPSQAHMAERNRLIAQSPGVDQVYGNITGSQFGQAHPLAGKLLGGAAEVGAKIGDTLLNGIPGIAREIPGTSVHHTMLLNQANQAVSQDEANALKEAQTANENADANERNADTEAKLNPPAKPAEPEKWKPLLGGNGEVVTAPNGSIVEVNDTGDVRAQSLPAGTSVGPKPVAAGHTAFDQWSADPQKFESFQKSMAEIKAEIAAEHPAQAKNSSFMNIYAAQRFLQMAYTHNPALLPVASQMIGKLLNLTPEQTAQMGQVPTDQPLSPTTGAPIGTSMPSAPTGGTRSQAQTAQRALDEIPRIRQSITQLGNELGPALGRWNEFETGKIGAGDPRYETLRTDLTFLNSAAAKFHLNSVRAVQEFQHLAQAGKMTPQVLNGYIDAVQDWATTAAKQERGAGETQQAPSGATELEIGPDGKLRVKGGK